MKLSQEEIEKALKNVAGWKYRGLLIKEFEFNDFEAALSFVNKVGEIAQSKNHHPNILIHDYKKVRIETSTHSENGITEKDLDLVKAINKTN